MVRTHLVKPVEKIPRSICVIPVVAGVVDSDEVPGFLSQRARTLNKIVAREEKLINRVTKSFIFAGHGCCRSHPAGLRAISASKLGEEGRSPALVAGRLRQVNSLEEG